MHDNAYSILFCNFVSSEALLKVTKKIILTPQWYQYLKKNKH